MMSGFIENLLSQYQQGTISDEEHIANIKSVSDYSGHFPELFVNGSINFGIAQKMLNLYLKYQWCLDTIPKPPHFHVDRIIQQELNKISRSKNLPVQGIEPGTHFKDASNYVNVIDFAKSIRDSVDSYSGFSLAQLELTLFNRR